MRNRLSTWVMSATLATGGCGLDTLEVGPRGVLLAAPASADETTERLLEETGEYLRRLTGGDPQIMRVASGRMDDLVRRAGDRGAGLVLVFDADQLASDEVDQDRVAGLGEWGFALQTEDAGNWANRLEGEGATFVLMAGGSTLSKQYANYEVLRRLGVRFYHPEQEYVPRHALADLRDLARRPTAIHRGSDDYLPDFAWRSWSFHSAHPLEHLEAFSDSAEPISEARNVNLWQIKNFGNRFRGAGRGVASEGARAQRVSELESMRQELGFPRGTGITLHNQQQGATLEIDRDSDIPAREQIEALVDQRLSSVPDARWFGIQFGPTEFSTTEEEETVDWLNWAGLRALERSPEIEIDINDHITGAQPVLSRGDLGCPSQPSALGKSDYYDLAFHTEPQLGVRVHTVMFYPLEGPARVYNQQTFAHKLCLMERASSQGRRLSWFPEGSWWLSFDNPIPVYLPLYVWTRWRDIDLIKPLLAARGTGTLGEHRMFNSGQEWGYWQQDYAVGLLGWNADVTPEQIWGEILEPICEASDWRDGCSVRDEVMAVLSAMIDHQREMFLEQLDWQGKPGGLYSYFAGEDQADIIAATGGFEFRPVRVSFADVMGWNPQQLQHFRVTDLAALNSAAVTYAGWRDRMRRARDFVAEPGLPWFDEIADGIEINEMRARQTAALYSAVIEVREAGLSEEPNPETFGEAQYSAAQMVLAQAEVVIRRREAAYRYPPEQMFGGGLTAQTAVPNGTTYPYRVHTKTHLLTYWTNRDAEVRAIINGDQEAKQNVQMVEPMDAPGVSLTLQWPQTATLAGSITIGEDVVDPSINTLDLGPDAGYWAVAGELTADNPYIDARGGIVRSSVRAVSPKAALELLVPDDPAAQGALASVFPSIQWAWLDEPPALVLAPDPNADGSVNFRDVIFAAATVTAGNRFETASVELAIPVSTSGGESVLVHLTEVVFSGEVSDGALVDPIGLVGNISVGDLVATLVALAGFDEPGSLAFLAETLGFDPANPPDAVPVEALVEVMPRDDE